MISLCDFVAILSKSYAQLLSSLSGRADQLGGGTSTHGRLEFHQEPIIDQRMGVHKDVFRLQLRHVGSFWPPQCIADAMIHGLHGALSNLLDDYKTIDGRNRIYVSLSSDHLGNAFDGCG